MSSRLRSEIAFGVSGDDFLIERHIAGTMNAAHWHNHVEINFLAEGRMSYLFNGRQEHVEAGTLVLFWAAIPHRTVDVTPNAQLVCIYLPLADFLGLSIDRGIRQSIMQGRFLIDPRPYPTDAALVSQWVREWEGGNAARRRLVAEEVRLRVRRLVLDAVQAPDAASRPAGVPVNRVAVRRAETLTELIAARHADPVSLAELASLAGIHPSTANRNFREVLGISVNEYLARYRLAQAMQRLADTDDPILQIGYGCGFGSSSRFYDLFRRRTGMSPGAFRKWVGASGTAQADPTRDAI